MYGEKFIEKKIEGNKKIMIFEFKKFEFDYEEIAIFFNDYIDDDYESLYNMGICLDYDDFYSLDCDTVLDSIYEYIENHKDDCEEEDGLIVGLKKFIKPLEEAKGFIIYFRNKDGDYCNHKPDKK